MGRGNWRRGLRRCHPWRRVSNLDWPPAFAAEPGSIRQGCPAKRAILGTHGFASVRCKQFGAPDDRLALVSPPHAHLHSRKIVRALSSRVKRVSMDAGVETNSARETWADAPSERLHDAGGRPGNPMKGQRGLATGCADQPLVRVCTDFTLAQYPPIEFREMIGTVIVPGLRV